MKSYGTAAFNFADAQFLDSPAAFRTTSANFNFCDGHEKITNGRVSPRSPMRMTCQPQKIPVGSLNPVPMPVPTLTERGLAAIIPVRKTLDLRAGFHRD
jgi:prepilin-type processing-associated H-X9-DG protein